jgi:hypothetical protein
MSAKSLPKNPFALLRISTRASNQEVVQRGRELIEDIDHRELQDVYRKAIESIISHPAKRAMLALWEMPDTDYEECDEAWHRFAKWFSVNPVCRAVQAQAEQFVNEYLEPSALLELLSPLLNVSRQTEMQDLLAGLPAADDVGEPLSCREIY